MKRITFLLLLFLSGFYGTLAAKHAVPRLLDTEILYADTLWHALEAKGFWLTQNSSEHRINMAGIWRDCYCYAFILKYDSVHAIQASIEVKGKNVDSVYQYFFDDMQAQFPNARYRQLTKGDTIFDYWGDERNDRAYAIVELYRVQQKTGKFGFQKKTTEVMCEVSNLDAYQKLSGRTLPTSNKHKNQSSRLWWKIAAVVVGLLWGLIEGIFCKKGGAK